MSTRKIKLHPGVSSDKPSLIQRETYVQELEKLREALQPSKQWQDALRQMHEPQEQLRKLLGPSKQCQDTLKQIRDSQNRLYKSLKPSKQALAKLAKAKKLAEVFEKHGGK